MATKIKAKRKEDGSYRTVTKNDISVGSGGNNMRRADVQLIQFFLKQFYDQHPEILCTFSAGSFKIDGICGNQTNSGIWRFQQYQSQRGVAITVDGLVDIPISGTDGSISKTQYTIWRLNKWFERFGKGSEHSANLENHPDIINYAPELRTELAMQKL